MSEPQVDVQPAGVADPVIRRSIEAAQQYLLGIQDEDGHWRGELEGDSILESEYILAMYFLGRHREDRVRKAANYLRKIQMPDGGWAIYPGGPAEVSASVKAYLVLKLLGDDTEAPHMVRARRSILDLGGVEAANSFTKIYLAIFGLYDWERCPAIPPEIILLPSWFFINVYEMSSWSRAIVIPLSIAWAHRLRCPLPDHATITELYTDRRSSTPPSLWGSLFLGIDRGIKILERVLDKLPVKPSRELALKRCHQWIMDRLEGSHGLGAIFPPIVNTIFALRAMGYPLDDPTIQNQVRELERLEIEEDDTLRVQPCLSPVWDTALTVNALRESGLAADHSDLLRAARWLLQHRGHGEGDWRVKNRHVEKPGWYFEYANPYYPDCDTTCQVMTTLAKMRFPDRAEHEEVRRAMDEAWEWHREMQNRDGGWGAFDKACDKEFLTYVPFADHNAMIDPSTADLTARAVEAYVGLGHDRSLPALQRAVEYLRNEQEEDGSWYGRWGCNYLYGTWLATWALNLAGEFVGSERGQRAASWLKSCQNDDGGWGELPVSYHDARRKGQGPSTASQTAWAILGLIATGDARSDAVRRGIDYLVLHQQPDGCWKEDYWTGTGFPCVFYLRYHLYATYFPLLALGIYEKSPQPGNDDPDLPVATSALDRRAVHGA